MKIVMVTGSYPPQPCGIGDYTFRLVRELQEAGETVDVVTTSTRHARAAPEVKFTLDNWKRESWRAAVDWISLQEYDILHIQYPGRFYGYVPDLAFLSSIARKKVPRMPIVVTVHEFGLGHFLRKLTVATIATYADKVIVTALSEQQQLERWVPWIRNKVCKIHLATLVPTIFISPSERKALRNKYALADDDCVIGYSGFLHPNKGVERLLRAFAMVMREHSSARLLMMSLVEPEQNAFHRSLLALASRLQLEKNITWTGFLDAESLSRHLGIPDVGAAPYDDGVSLRRLSFMTLLSHGVPTLTTMSSVDPRELGLIDRENVLLVPRGRSPEMLAEGISTLLGSVELRQKLRRGGLEWSKRFHWETIIAETRSAYSEVARRKVR